MEACQSFGGMAVARRPLVAVVFGREAEGETEAEAEGE